MEKSDYRNLPTQVGTYAGVVTEVRALGDEAVEQFLDELAPHFDAILSQEPNADQHLAESLYDWAISARIIRSLGGISALAELNRNFAVTDAITPNEFAARLAKVSFE